MALKAIRQSFLACKIVQKIAKKNFFSRESFFHSIFLFFIFVLFIVFCGKKHSFLSISIFRTNKQNMKREKFSFEKISKNKKLKS